MYVSMVVGRMEGHGRWWEACLALWSILALGACAQLLRATLRSGTMEFTRELVALNESRASLAPIRFSVPPEDRPRQPINATEAAARCAREKAQQPNLMLSCHRSPPCIINEAKYSLVNKESCRRRQRYEDWPTYDPELLPSTLTSKENARRVFDMLKGRNLVVAGDSTSNQDWRGLRCAFDREDLIDYSRSREVVARWRAWGQSHHISCCGQAVALRSGGSFVFVGIYRYNQTVLDWIIDAAEGGVILLNYGLHYRHDDLDRYTADMRAFVEHVAGGAAGKALILLRETSAQHFQGTGSYVRGAEKMKRCSCQQHTSTTSRANAIRQQNQVLGRIVNDRPASIGVVPFYTLTANRWNSHNEDGRCSGGRDSHRCHVCDCVEKPARLGTFAGRPPPSRAYPRGALSRCRALDLCHRRHAFLFLPIPLRCLSRIHTAHAGACRERKGWACIPKLQPAQFDTEVARIAPRGCPLGLNTPRKLRWQPWLRGSPLGAPTPGVLNVRPSYR